MISDRIKPSEREKKKAKGVTYFDNVKERYRLGDLNIDGMSI